MQTTKLEKIYFEKFDICQQFFDSCYGEVWKKYLFEHLKHLQNTHWEIPKKVQLSKLTSLSNRFRKYINSDSCQKYIGSCNREIEKKYYFNNVNSSRHIWTVTLSNTIINNASPVWQLSKLFSLSYIFLNNITYATVEIVKSKKNILF